MAFILAKKIIQAHPNGFIGAIVEGKRGMGKSAYCIKIMKEVYQTMYDCTETEAWKYALKHILFDLDDVIPFLKQASDSDDMIPVCTWDDAGVHGSNIRWFTNMHQVEMLKAMTDTIRTGVTGFLLNCPSKTGLLKVLRHYDDYLVNIIKTTGPSKEGYNGYDRIGRGYNLYRLPDGKLRVYKHFEDHYSCYLPNWVYKEYMVVRKMYFQKAVAVMEEMQKKLKMRKDGGIQT